ncbi:DUF4861 family protein [Marinoscillum sp.]|uniref:DUF4861 family protein n=1 Tax=Marinoscillum sp. TaxID=2024838 RepID=UPI003BA85DD4
MKRELLPIYFLIVCAVACTSDRSQTMTVTNLSDIPRHEVVELDWETPVSDNLTVSLEGEPLPSEWVDIDKDGKAERLRVLVSLNANEAKELLIGINEKQVKDKLTQAELSIKVGGQWTNKEYEGGEFKNVDYLRVPEQHTDHTYYIRYEGPGWESDKMAYRFYLDWRNGMDVFGKLTPEPVLQQVGQDGFDSYHELGDWGMDLLKVGSTLGVGSIGRYANDTLYRFKQTDSVTCAITENGLLKSEITTRYYGWSDGGTPTDLASVIGIEAGSALTSHKLTFSNPIDNFCTGIVANKGEDYIDEVVGDYRILASFGNFSLNNDNMGLAVILENNSLKDVKDGAGSHVALFRPDKEVVYHFMAVWEKGTSAIKSMDEFMVLLRAEANKLNQPLEVTVSN